MCVVCVCVYCSLEDDNKRRRLLILNVNITPKSAKMTKIRQPKCRPFATDSANSVCGNIALIPTFKSNQTFIMIMDHHKEGEVSSIKNYGRYISLKKYHDQLDNINKYMYQKIKGLKESKRRDRSVR